MASLSLVFTVTTPVTATGVTFTPAALWTVNPDGSFGSSQTVAQSTIAGSLAVQPTNWQGTLQLSGANANSFILQGTNLVVASDLTAPNTYNVTVVATP